MTTGPRPCARSSHCLVHATIGGESPESTETSSFDGSLVVFGGLGSDETAKIEGEEECMPLNDLWVLSPASPATLSKGGEAAATPAAGHSSNQTLPLWTLVLLDGVGPSPRSLSALAARRPPSIAVNSDDDGDDDNCSESYGHDTARDSNRRTAELFIFGGYGLVELPSDKDGKRHDDSHGQDSDEDGEIIMAYIDDLWGLSLMLPRRGGESVDGCSVNSNSKTSCASSDCVGPASENGWVDEEQMGYPGTSPVEGRNGHTLTWCGDKLILFGGFVGDGFDAGVHVAEVPSVSTVEL